MMLGPHSETRTWRTDIARDNAEQGSVQLRWAMRREFMGFAMKHNVTFKDAKLLLMNGISF